MACGLLSQSQRGWGGDAMSSMTHETDGNPLFPIILSLVAAAATGVLWAYANPIQLVPGVIQWRIFAFLPPLVGILLGSKSGFICGYLGTIVWSLLAGTFIPLHSLIVDGIMVGLTGFVPGLLFNPARAGMDKKALVKIAMVCAAVGLVMVVAVSASLAYLGIFPFWWAVGYLGLSDIVPMVIGTPLLVLPAMKILKSAHPNGFSRF
jgi:uncharacterized membrane protein